MASIAELEYAILDGELKERIRENKLSRTRTREATTQDTEEYPLSSLLHPVNVRIEKKEREITSLAYEEAMEHYNKAIITVIIYSVFICSFLIWAAL